MNVRLDEPIEHVSVGVATSVLEGLIADGIYGTSAQLFVEHTGRVVCDVALGTVAGGGSIARSTLLPAYCATKPLVPVAVAFLLDDDALDLISPLSSFASDLPWVPPSATIADLLTHNAGMAEPTAALWRMTPENRRAALFASEPASAGPAYSEIGAWSALIRIIEELTAEPAERFVESRILRPAGLDNDVIIDSQRALTALAANRVQVPLAGLPVEAVPLLSEALPQQLADVNLAFGGLTNASGLGRLYTDVRRAMAGENVSGMPSRSSLLELLRHRRETSWDTTLRRRCAFAGGFMIDLEQHGFTEQLPKAFGHSSGIVPTFALCDPQHEVTIACVLNGVSPSSEDLRAIRRSIIAAALREIEVTA